MAITLTDSAAQRVQRLLAQEGGLGLRLGLKNVGCAGMAYTFAIAHELAEGDQVFEDNGAKVVVDRQAFIYLNGTQLDFVKDGLKEIFRLKNPNEKSACGCGESVSFNLAPH